MDETTAQPKLTRGQRYYAKYSARERARHARYYAENRERVLARNVRWQHENREARNEIARRYYARHRTLIRAQRRADRALKREVRLGIRQSANAAGATDSA